MTKPKQSPEAKKFQALTAALRKSEERARIAENNLEVERQHHANTKAELEETRKELRESSMIASDHGDAMHLLYTLPLPSPRRRFDPITGASRNATISERITYLASRAS